MWEGTCSLLSLLGHQPMVFRCEFVTKHQGLFAWTEKSRATIIRIAPHSGIVLHYKLLKAIVGSVKRKKSAAGTNMISERHYPFTPSPRSAHY
jgi:hypothetical protein